MDKQQEFAEQIFELFGVRTFPDFVRICKKENNGVIPTTFQGVDINQQAAICGYKITADRHNYYMPPTVSTVADLMQKELTPPPFAVEGLLPAGLCIFSAPSKTGKSWFALDLCHSVANGSPFMDRPTNKGDALYLALEDSEVGLQGRLRKIGCSDTSSMHYAFSAPPVGYGMTEFLTEWCESVSDPRLIVIDVIQRAKPSSKASRTSYEQDYELYAPLNAFALERGIAIVAITHNRKSNGLAGDDYESISGSVGQMGSAQTAWLIMGKRGQTEEKTFKATGRDIREVEDLIRFNPDSCKWENNGSAEAAAQRSLMDNYESNPIRKTLIELLDVEGHGYWRGTYEDLFEEVADKTGQYPFETATKLSKGIRQLLPLLAQYDGIHHKRDKHHSGYHDFYREKIGGV